MPDKLTIARPYARAAFEEARLDQRLDPWSEALHAAAEAARDARVAALLGNPQVTPEELAELFIGVTAAHLGPHGENFLRTLALNHRLGYLPEISTLFDQLKNVAEGVADVTVISAAPLDGAQKDKLAGALQKRLKRTVRVHGEVDRSLIGGAVLRSGDLVIDGSLRTSLERIAYELTS